MVTSAQTVIVFDGVCVLCSRFFKFIVARDPEGRFCFATAQSAFGQALYIEQRLPTDDFETFLVVQKQEVFQKLDGVCVIMAQLGWPWRGLSILRWLPGPVKRWLYDLIAKNRYKVFGRKEFCMLPNATEESRFVPGGWQ